MKKRILSLLTALALCLSLFPATALAAEGMATDENPATQAPADEAVTEPTSDPSEGAETQPGEAVEPETASACPHGEEALFCPVCPVQALIDALPDAETITTGNAPDVIAQLEAIDEAKLPLTDEELDALDFTRYQAAVTALEALAGQPGANEPEPLAGTGAFTVTGGALGDDYTFVDGVLTVITGTPLTISGTSNSDTIEVAAGVNANITLSGVNIDVSATENAVAFKIEDNITGNVTVTLVGSNTLKSGKNCAGLQKNGGSGVGTLTIKGKGSLTATGGYGAAGIGGGNGHSSSKITIEDGNVGATGGRGAAGIGGGSGGSGSHITISGGTVTATGGTLFGAGIGGGSSGNGSDITISGGKVRATGRTNAAGIGGGQNGSGSNIMITGGDVEAMGGNGAAGIGGGFSGSGTVTISGGTVKAQGGTCAAGIGGGQNGSGSDITISGGTVTATGGTSYTATVTWNGAGIGGGGCNTDSIPNINITISGGDVTAIGAAGIGSGGSKESVDGSTTVTISGGTVKATGGQDAAGIGNGKIGSGSTFSTGDAGSAFIDASSISDKSSQGSWSGVVFEGNNGQVYGNPTLTTGAEIPSGKTLTIPENTILTVSTGVTLTNNGTIINNGTIDIVGTLISNGTITNNGTIKGLIGAGTEADPFCISSKDELYAFAAAVNSGKTFEGKTVVLTADIVVNEKVLDSSGNPNSGTFEAWTPIGTYKPQDSKKFCGTFDGQNHTVSGLYFNDKDTSFVGLFGFSTGVIKNVGVIGSYFHGHYNVGGVCGWNLKTDDLPSGGVIENCWNESTVTAKTDTSDDGTYIGGVCGENASGIVRNCYNTGKVDGRQEVGGVCGYNVNGGNVINCHNEGAVSGRIYIGGVCGSNRVLSGTTESVIKDCYNLGTVSSNYMYSGGVCGMNGGSRTSDSTCTITSCYNSGAVACDLGFSGGVCGLNYFTIENCYNTGAVTGSETDDYGSVGGVCGRSCNNGTIANCYNTGSVYDSAKKFVGGICGRDESNDTIFTNCYYRTGCATTGDNAAQNGIGCDTEGQTTTDIEGSTTPKTAEEFASGAAVGLLQGSQTDEIWGQTIGTDPSPVLLALLSAEEQPEKLCKVTFMNGGEEHGVRYANLGKTVALPEEPVRDNFVFKHWSQTNDTGGDTFDASTTVNADMTVYAVWQEPYGQIEGEKTVTTTYGSAVEQDLSAYMVYGGTTAAAGKFTYKIKNGNDNGYFSIDGDKLKVSSTTPAATYNLTITATEKTPQISVFAANSLGTSPVDISVTVKVSPKTIEAAMIGDIGAQVYTGNELTPDLTVRDGDKVLARDADYTLTYSNNKNVGTADVEVKGIGNYTGTVTKQFVIKKADQATPTVNINYTDETLSTTAAMEWSVDGSTWTVCTENMNVSACGWDGSAKTVQFRAAGDDNHNPSQAVNVSIPARPAAPDTALKLTKTME